MSVKKCAREECGKTVYPIEELKCLDKVWHKQCFKCSSCGMTLNMKNYKGYNKMPYCEPHYPKTVASVVIDTPEMRRLAENTKYQSQVQYHADYEKMRGTKIEIADDPELMRHMQNSKVQSQAQYHGELEKKKQQDTNRPKEELVNEGIPAQDRQVGSIADYDPMNGNWGTAAGGGGTGAVNTKGKESTGPLEPSSATTATKALGGGAQKGGAKAANTASAAAAQLANAAQPPPGSARNKGFSVKALYDYTAADTDEVSFLENDIIVNCQKVDDGWMTGTVQRTLQWGMLPANYVERVNQPTGLFKLH